MTSGSERGRKLWTGLFIGALRFLLSLSFRCVLLSLSVTASFDYLFLVFFAHSYSEIAGLGFEVFGYCFNCY